MGILGADAEAPIRADLELLLPDRCTVRRGAAVSDGAGGWTGGDADAATNVPCRADRDQSVEREALIAGRSISQGGYVVMLSTVASRWPGGVIDIRASDSLIVTGDAAGTYQPLGSGGPTTDEFVREVRCIKVG